MAKPGRVIKRTAQAHAELTAEDINNWRKLSLESQKSILNVAINKQNPDNDFYMRYLGNVLALMALDFEGKTPKELARWEPYLEHVHLALKGIHGTRAYIHIIRGGIFKEDLPFCILCRVIEKMLDEHKEKIIPKLQGERGWGAFQEKSKEHNLDIFNPRLELSAHWVKNLRDKINQRMAQEDKDRELVSSYAQIGEELDVIAWGSDYEDEHEHEEKSPQAAAVKQEGDTAQEPVLVDPESPTVENEETVGWAAWVGRRFGFM